MYVSNSCVYRALLELINVKKNNQQLAANSLQRMCIASVMKQKSFICKQAIKNNYNPLDKLRKITQYNETPFAQLFLLNYLSKIMILKIIKNLNLRLPNIHIHAKCIL